MRLHSRYSASPAGPFTYTLETSHSSTAVGFGGGKFLSVTWLGTSGTHTSTDGKTWTDTGTVFSDVPVSVHYFNGYYLVAWYQLMGSTGGVRYSASGTSWSAMTGATFSWAPYTECHSSTYLAVIGNHSYYSTNGTSFTEATPSGLGYPAGVATDGSGFAIAEQYTDKGKIYYSSDGKGSWTGYTNLFPTGWWFAGSIDCFCYDTVTGYYYAAITNSSSAIKIYYSSSVSSGWAELSNGFPTTITGINIRFRGLKTYAAISGSGGEGSGVYVIHPTISKRIMADVIYLPQCVGNVGGHYHCVLGSFSQYIYSFYDDI